MLTRQWVKSFISLTTKKWAKKDFLGNDILPGTGWLSGINGLGIKKIEKKLGISLPDDLKLLLSETKGLNKKEKQTGYIGDKEIIQFVNKWHLEPSRIDDAVKFAKSWINRKTYKIIKEESLIPKESQQNFFLLPIYGHRFIVCDQNNPSTSVIISIYDEDIVVYGKDLKDYLKCEFLD